MNMNMNNHVLGKNTKTMNVRKINEKKGIFYFILNFKIINLEFCFNCFSNVAFFNI